MVHEQLEGVYYALHDYAGLGRRLLILIIDGGILFMVFLAVMICYSLAGAGPLSSFHLYAIAYATCTFLYLAVLGRSRFGTIGYALTSVRVVDLRGQRPPLSCMLFRTLFAVLGPLNALLDLIWLGGDNDRQALRDKLAGTYVIRRGAQPLGTGLQKHVMITFGYWSFLVREVSRKVT
jgi:uncharacterized RDD family membrane protein YckC